MSTPERPKEKTDWRRIGLVATVLLVPGGFVLGAVLAARRMRAGVLGDEAAIDATPAESDPEE